MTLNLLHVDSSILGSHSISRTLSAAVVARLKAGHPQVNVTTRDVAAEPITHLSGTSLAPPETELDDAGRADRALGEAVINEFLAADIVVIGVAMYNFSVSSQLKAWVDRIVISGETFRYTEMGVQGLVGGKRVILAISRGSSYAPDSDAEHAERWMRTVLGFIGISAPEVIVAEGVSRGPQARTAAVDGALAAIGRLAA